MSRNTFGFLALVRLRIDRVQQQRGYISISRFLFSALVAPEASSFDLTYYFDLDLAQFS